VDNVDADVEMGEAGDGQPDGSLHVARNVDASPQEQDEHESVVDKDAATTAS
jgi:hypothetical protein